MDEPRAAAAAPGDALPRDADDEVRALAAVEKHHATMLQRLDALAKSLTHAVKAADALAEHAAHEILLEWCETELVPHALAEEGPLYGAPQVMPEGRLLVESLLADNQVMVALVDDLRPARGVDAAVTAGALRRIFALHLDRENRLLLPFITSTPGLSLAAAVEGHEELVGESHIHGEGADRRGSV